MKSSKLVRSAVTGLVGLTLALGACSSSNDNGTGAGGHGGSSAGTAGSGGSGTGGNGGTTGTGGSSTGGTSAGTAGTGGSSSAGTGGSATGGTGGSSAGGTSGGSGGGGGGEAGRGGGGAGEAGRGGTGGSGGRGGGSAGGGGSGGGTGGSGSGTFTLTSPNLVDGAKFAAKYTCNGGALGAGVNPQLDWTGVPAGTKAFAITFIDTTLGANMATGQHWAIWNIPWDAGTGKVSSFSEGTTTLSGDLATAMQTNKFLAPCAQSLMGGMDDQYAFTIYALSATLNITGASGSAVANSAGVAKVLQALQGVQPLGMAVLHAHAGLKGQ